MDGKEEGNTMKRQWGLYLHIPFCRQKCFYCDFPSFAGRERYEADYTDALCRELLEQGVLYREKWGRPATIYMGGGTPSILPVALMEHLLQTVCRVFALTGDEDPSELEFTVECNPGTVDAEKLTLLRSYGVNRLSFGVQTFDDGLLQAIGRIHTGQQAKEAMQLAREAGFRNVSMDLMYGLPHESLAVLQHDLETMIALEPEHISIYGLQLEEGTAFYRMQELGRFALPDEETVEQMYDLMASFLPAHGYARYEISNFARPGYESRHNLSYWQDVPYLGVGAAAHSYLEGRRYANGVDIPAYIRAMQAGGSVREEEEPADRAIAMEEFAFLALRTSQGLSREAFFRRFAVSLERIYSKTIHEMKQKGLLEEQDGWLRLTPLGMKYGNLVFEAFLLT